MWKIGWMFIGISTQIVALGIFLIHEQEEILAQLRKLNERRAADGKLTTGGRG